MQRRDLFRSMFGLCGSSMLPLATGGCSRPVTRDEVLAGIIEHLAMPDIAAVAHASQRLHASLTALVSRPNAETLGTARDAWRAAAAMWRQAGAFRQSPLVATSAVVRATFWPPRPTAVEQLMSDATPVDDAYVKSVGVDLKGMYGLESFLFPLNLDDAAVVAQFDKSRVRCGQLVVALAGNVSLGSWTTSNKRSVTAKRRQQTSRLAGKLISINWSVR